MVQSRVLTGAGVVLVAGAIAAGCGGSSSRGGTPLGSTTAGATSGTNGGSTSTGNPTTPAIPQAPASAGNPLDAFNRELQQVWDVMRPTVLAQLEQMVQQQLAGQRLGSGTISAEIRNARLSPSTSMAVAPGLVRMDTRRVELRAPLQGSWQVALDCDLRVQLSVGSLSPAIDIPVTLVLQDLTVAASADIDDADPARPVLQRVDPPQVSFTLRLDSTNSLAQQLLGALSQPANFLAQAAITSVLSSLAPQLSGIQGIPGAIPGDGAAPLADSGAATPFEEVANNVSLKIRQVNTPHGCVLRATMDTPSTESWLVAFQNGGPGVRGAVTDYEDGGDSAIWTGHWLAAEAFRYGVTQDSLALDNIGHALAGVGALFDVNGGTGLLARSVAPESSITGQNIVRGNRVFRRAQINGQTWVSMQGGNGISRDQYSGIMFGLSICWELVPPARPDCERRIAQVLDYLIARDWIITEDRPPAGTSGSRGPTFWAGVQYQKLAFLLMGHRFDQTRWAQEIAAAGPLTELAWFGAWTGVMGIDHYYKYNLGHIGHYNYFRLETDQTRWQQMRRAWSITNRYVGHHRNPHFDLIHCSIDPAARQTLFPCVRESMRRFLDMSHREVAPAVIDLSGVTFVQLPQFGYANTPTGGFTLTQTTQTFPTEPLDPILRRPTDFQWQRDPFTPAQPNEGSPYQEKVGADVLLPYWMGRHLGAF